MSDTSGERLARQVRRACGPYNDPELPVVQIVLDLKEKADRLAAIEREIGGRRESYRAMRDFMDTDPVARSCYQGFINTLDELRAIIDVLDADEED